jgi:hypothetical protein
MRKRLYMRWWRVAHPPVFAEYLSVWQWHPETADLTLAQSVDYSGTLYNTLGTRKGVKKGRVIGVMRGVYKVSNMGKTRDVFFIITIRPMRGVYTL